MADITPDEGFAALSLVAGRPSVALAEIIRLLTVNLPGHIANTNTRLGTSIPVPKAYRIAPQTLSDAFLNTILFRIVTEKEVESRGVKNTSHVYIFAINENLATPSSVPAGMDQIGVIEGLLWNCNNTWYDPAGRCVWTDLLPIGEEDLPEEYAPYVGRAGHFQMIQHMNTTLWT